MQKTKKESELKRILRKNNFKNEKSILKTWQTMFRSWEATNIELRGAEKSLKKIEISTNQNS